MAETTIEDFSSVADWTSLAGTLTSSSGQGAGTAATDNLAVSNAASYGPDIFVGITVSTLVANDNEYILLGLRITNVPTTNGYYVSYVRQSGTDTMYLRRSSGGTPTTIGSWAQEVAAGNRIGISAVGSTITAYIDTGSGWTVVGSVTDANFNTAGALLLDIYNTTARVDDLVQVTADATKRLLLMGAG